MNFLIEKLEDILINLDRIDKNTNSNYALMKIINNTLDELSINVEDLEADLLKDIIDITPNQQKQLDDIEHFQKIRKDLAPIILLYSMLCEAKKNK